VAPRGDKRLEKAVDAARAACRALAAIVEAKKRADEHGGEAAARRAWGLARNAAESLLARARQAPSLLATWGPGAFLVFYASKAAGLADGSACILDSLVDYLACRGDEKKHGSGEAQPQSGAASPEGSRECSAGKLTELAEKGPPASLAEEKRKKGLIGELGRHVDATSLGYALYLAALARYLGMDGSNACEAGAEGSGRAPLAVKAFDRLIEEAASGKLRHTELLYAVETISRLITIYLEPVLGQAQAIAKKEKDGQREALELLISGCSLEDKGDMTESTS